MPNTYGDFADQEEKDTLASAMKRGQKKIADVARAGDTAQPLDSQAAQYYLDQIKQANDQYSPTAPPESRKALADALDKAQQLYKDQANKNEWLEVAQILGRAGTQYAAAQGGMASGRNMAGLDLGPAIDYGARTEGARKDFSQTARNLGDLNDQAQRDYQNTEKANQENYKRSTEAPEKGLSAALREEEIRRREQADTDRENRGNKAAGERDDRALRASNIKDLDAQEKELTTKLKARQSLANMLQQEGDLSGKAVAKLQEKYGSIAAQGDVDLAALKTELDKQTKPGMISNLTGGAIETTNPDEEKQGNLLKGKVDELRNLLDGVRARKASLLQGKQSPASQESPGGMDTPPSPPPAAKTKKVQGPSGQIVEFPSDIADKYLSKPGYKEVK